MEQRQRAPSKILKDVPRETKERLLEYHELLLRWTERINLIAPSTRPDAWSRHIADSAQLWEHVPEDAETWADLGSGGGLPGLVIAILAAAGRPTLHVTMIESDRRKAAFLQHAATRLELHTTVVPRRVEETSVNPQDVISARAVAPLSRLIALAHPLLHGRSVMLFSKGRNVLSELTDAERSWHIRHEIVPSRIEGGGAIVKIFGVESR